MGRQDRHRGEARGYRPEGDVGENRKEVSKMSNGKSVNPTVPTGPTPNRPIPPTEVGDMEHFHRMATSGALADLLFKLGGTRKK
jgi:hypothetical protein